MGACYNTILLPVLGRDALLTGIAEFLAEHGAEIACVEDQERPGQAFATNAAMVVLFGPPAESGWIPVTSWGDGLVPYPQWYTANPMARSMSRVAREAIYLFSFDAGFVAGSGVFTAGEHVEGQVVPWRQSAPVDPDFALPALFWPGVSARSDPGRAGF